jgi:uncharacterized protein YyaL (SSP411 family)
MARLSSPKSAPRYAAQRSFVTHSHTNRLAKETSPYLLQHQHNPVDWYAWGPEAFEAARTQNKPIFLSVGYSTCYWCHVMERQCFENDTIAAEMNQRFINIKVDREERPDVDQLYMTAVQVLTRQGGWPMSVFLLPDLRPFYGGTYFPPSDALGRPGFPTLLRALEDAYRNRRSDVEKSAEQLVDILNQLARPSLPAAPIQIDEPFIERLIDRSVSDYDPEFGGFGRAPKFPRQTLLELILVYLRDHPDAHREKMIRHTLDALANGGIRDHLGGGFHRYSTDAHWLVPHFEIMLYDNAMLAWVYAEAYRQFKEPRYAAVARGICDFVLREMTDPAGGFYTAFDAEVHGQEGLNYLWTAAEVEEELGADDAQLFNRVYGLADGPNFADPHHGNGTPDKNILFLPDGPALENVARIIAMRQKLLSARLTRKQPLLDTKILTSWNALMIRALAFAGDVLKEPRYVKAATVAADFLLKWHADGDSGLYRTSRDGPAKYHGFLDDHAFLIQALLTLAKSTRDEKWREHAGRLATTVQERFSDPEAGGFYFTDNCSAELIVRQKIASDSPLPSGNAIAACVLLDLGQTDAARAVLIAFAEQLKSNGEGMSSMVQAAVQFVQQHGPVSTASAKTPDEPADEIVSLAAQWSDSSSLKFTVTIRDGFHIGATDAHPHMVDTHLSVDGTAAQIVYPPPQKVVFPFAEDELKVYQGKIEIGVRFATPPPGPVRCMLRFQACSDRACLAVVNRSIEVPPAR